MKDKNNKTLKAGDFVLMTARVWFGNMLLWVSFVAKVKKFKDVYCEIIQLETGTVGIAYKNEIELLPRNKNKRNEKLMLLKLQDIS